MTASDAPLAGVEPDWLRERFGQLPRPRLSDPLVESPQLLCTPEPLPGDEDDIGEIAGALDEVTQP